MSEKIDILENLSTTELKSLLYLENTLAKHKLNKEQNMSDNIIITPHEVELEKVETIVVVRTPEEFAKAVMRSDPEFARIHKPKHNDPFVVRRNRK